MKTVITTCIALLLSAALVSQSGLDKREILVEKEYSDEIYNVNPIFDYASITVPRKIQPKFLRDSLISISPFTPDIDIAIKPVAYKNQGDNNQHHGFIKVDKGTLNPLYAQGGYTYTAANYFNLTAAAGYDNRRDNSIEDKHIQQIGGSVDMDYYLNKETKTDISISYDRSTFGLFSELDERTGSEVAYDNVSVGLGVRSFRTTPNHWNYRGHFDFDTWSSSTDDLNDRSFHTIGQVAYMVNDTWDFTFTPEYKVLTSDAFGSGSTLHGAIQAGYDIERFYAKAGIRLDRFGDRTVLWPDLDVRWNSGQAVDIYLRSQTSTEIWGGSFLTSINPYTSFSGLSSTERNISLDRNLEVAVKADLPRDILVTFKVGFSDADDQPNFIASDLDQRLFDIATIDYQRLHLTVDVAKSLWDQTVETGLRIRYNKYDVQEGILFNRPLFSVHPRIQTSLLGDKLSFSLDGLFNSPITYNLNQGIEVNSGWRAQISTGLSYKVLDRLSLQVDLDNILNDDFEVWQGYDVFGRNISGGVIVKL